MDCTGYSTEVGAWGSEGDGCRAVEEERGERRQECGVCVMRRKGFYNF